MNCKIDKRYKCRVNKFVWCRTCEKALSENRATEIKTRFSKYDVKDYCIMCALVDATPKTGITNHHVMPLKYSIKMTGRKLNHRLPMCEAHHKMFNELIRPFEYLIDTKMEGSEMRDWLNNYQLPNIVEKINVMIQNRIVNINEERREYCWL